MCRGWAEGPGVEGVGYIVAAARAFLISNTMYTSVVSARPLIHTYILLKSNFVQKMAYMV